MTTTLCKFYPVHGGSSDTTLRAGQRYRSPFNDQRLASRVDKTLDLLCRHRSHCINGISLERKDEVATFRLLANDKIGTGELIDYCCDISPDRVAAKKVLVAGDGSSMNLKLSGHGVRAIWARRHSCLVNSKVPGFQFMAGLVLDQHSHDVVGISDMLLYDSPRDLRSKEKRHSERRERLKLALTERESGSWTILADNSMRGLSSAEQVTFVFDREADSYENMTHLRQQTKSEFIIRQKYDRKAIEVISGRQGTICELLNDQKWIGVQTVKIRQLNHYSHTKGKKRRRQKRKAKLKIRYMKVHPQTPEDYHKYHPDRPTMKQPLYLVEVMEDESTVPKGEQPIRWKLWTTWKVGDAKSAWQVVDAYRARWNVEQLFRLLKKGGINLENSQLNHPDRIKRLLIMATKVSAEALRLVQARDGEHFISINEMFNEEEQTLLKKLNAKLSKKGSIVVNHHTSDGLAFAAWIIARLGGWNGYQSQRPPGPIKMHRGLKQFYELLEWRDILSDS